jgi:hypothetical protein
MSREALAAMLAHGQHSLAAALTSPAEEWPPGMLDAIVPGGTLDAAGALAVYRRGYHARLTEQLGETYATVWRVLGDDDFFAICREYIAGHPSSSYNLSDYGREFPAFLAAAPGLPAFLEELARFELAVHDVFHVHAHAPLGAARIAAAGDLSGVRLRFGRGVRLFAGDHAVYDLYRHRNDEEPPDLDIDRAQRVLLYRNGGDVLAREVDAAWFAALASLAEGRTVDQAIASAVASAVERDADFSAEDVSRLFEMIALCGLVESVER